MCGDVDISTLTSEAQLFTDPVNNVPDYNSAVDHIGVGVVAVKAADGRLVAEGTFPMRLTGSWASNPRREPWPPGERQTRPGRPMLAGIETGQSCFEGGP